MKSALTKAVSIIPEELVFTNVELNNTYTHSLTIQNNIAAPIELVLRLITLLDIKKQLYRKSNCKSK